ncbi:MAG: winged helix-turn-helix transcriptional regulator [Candidatus Vogelbacteria bacterium]|nr:winged helix-turn-helix transcriptional regulator [Candidatus Vogelbacteria bacterium]
MASLGKLFGSPNRLKLMRLFLLNPEAVMETRDVVERCKLLLGAATSELSRLKSAGLIVKRLKSRQKGWQLDPTFPFIEPLKNMLKNDLTSQRRELVGQFNACGRVTLLLLAGIFIDQGESRADLVIVGDHLKRAAVGRVIRALETELGKEINYAVLGTSEFTYRLNAGDKFIRDMLDFPHDVVVDKIGL